MVGSTDITTTDGVVRGHRGRRVIRWRSIPYAAAPVGDLRFRAPQPVQPWAGVRDATEFGAAAIQPKFGVRIGPRQFQEMSEDSLTLNVTAPVTRSGSPRPVLVFIHGGGYLFGTSALGLYSGSRLAVGGDVIVVSLNYRLGVFGYVDFGAFATETRPFDANIGLRDQIAALTWVQANIAAFGGDPGNVTIFGESAGAHAVLTLLATPAAEGLFHRAIAQSAPADWGLSPDDARAFAHRCLDRLGATPENASKVLVEADPHDLRRAFGRTAKSVMRGQPGFFPTAPVIDGELLPRAPIDAITGGHAHRVPLIIGTCRDEGRLFAKFADELPTTPERLRSALAHSGEAESKVLGAYPGFPREDVAIRAGGDYVFWRPSVAAMTGHSRYAPTYAYRYDFAPRALHLAGLGATHATDLIPVFGAGSAPVFRALTALGGRRGLQSVTRQFQDNWLRFAHTGAPLPSWPQYTEKRRSTLIIDAPSRIEHDPDQEKRIAWEGVRVPTLADARREAAEHGHLAPEDSRAI
ncbi:carboxylesterase/lipase family protein [Nocardia donostiensis]|uniref:Carboxylic ester hydrolase n=1 Tax=Nocardia donostiensis TaxID=1538463 RepID=A0A1V2TG61_9NOCA|nr:carboxylesterase/lipase family protein [Nocardia donostiensis]ONM48371.1 carboxylesterase [Nocardia donostiensis]OQS20519.1 carboxylesterase [Nocardia donostiensis]